MIETIKYIDCYLTQCSSNMWYKKVNKKYVVAVETIGNVDIFLLSFFPINRGEITSELVLDKILSFNSSDAVQVKRFKIDFMNITPKNCEK